MQSPNPSDFTIECTQDGTLILAHEKVLHGIPYFQALLNHSMIESTSRCLQLEDDPSAIEVYFRRVYDPEVLKGKDISVDTLCRVIIFANKMMDSAVVKEAIDLLTAQVTESKQFEPLREALTLCQALASTVTEHTPTKLIRQCHLRITKNPELCILLSQEIILYILKHLDLSAPLAAYIATEWILSHSDDRPDITEILQTLNYEQVFQGLSPYTSDLIENVIRLYEYMGPTVLRTLGKKLTSSSIIPPKDIDKVVNWSDLDIKSLIFGEIEHRQSIPKTPMENPVTYLTSRLIYNRDTNWALQLPDARCRVFKYKNGPPQLSFEYKDEKVLDVLNNFHRRCGQFALDNMMLLFRERMDMSLDHIMDHRMNSFIDRARNQLSGEPIPGGASYLYTKCMKPEHFHAPKLYDYASGNLMTLEECNEKLYTARGIVISFFIYCDTRRMSVSRHLRQAYLEPIIT